MHTSSNRGASMCEAPAAGQPPLRVCHPLMLCTKHMWHHDAQLRCGAHQPAAEPSTPPTAHHNRNAGAAPGRAPCASARCVLSPKAGGPSELPDGAAGLAQTPAAPQRCAREPAARAECRGCRTVPTRAMRCGHGYVEQARACCATVTPPARIVRATHGTRHITNQTHLTLRDHRTAIMAPRKRATHFAGATPGACRPYPGRSHHNECTAHPNGHTCTLCAHGPLDMRAGAVVRNLCPWGRRAHWRTANGACAVRAPIKWKLCAHPTWRNGGPRFGVRN